MTARVAVAMSGGVDSTVCALMYKRLGYEVIGLTMHLHGSVETDAVSVAKKIGIEHHVLDMKDIFNNEVIKPFVRAYVSGRTPNPCAICNPRIKFGVLLESALGLGAEKLITGHYVRLTNENGILQLKCGADKIKDQSYFLGLVPSKQLERVDFPLGAASKEEAYAIARECGVSFDDRRESQDVCFLPVELLAPV